MPFEINTDAIEKAAVKAAVDEIIDQYDWHESVAIQVKGRIDALFTEKMEAAISAQIESAVKSAFDYEYHEVDNFGRKVGESTTIAKRLDALVKDYWTERVDSQGRPAKKDGYNRDKNPTRAEWVMVQACGEDIHKHLTQEVINASAWLKDGLRKEMRGWTDSALARVFSVTSAMDKEEGRRS